MHIYSTSAVSAHVLQETSTNTNLLNYIYSFSFSLRFVHVGFYSFGFIWCNKLSLNLVLVMYTVQ